MYKTTLCIMYSNTAECDRSIAFAAALHGQIGTGKLHVYLKSDPAASALLQARIERPDDLQVERVRRQVSDRSGIGEESIEVRLYSQVAEIAFPKGAILIGPTPKFPRRDVNVLTPFDEQQLGQRSDGPIFIPFGDGESGIEAAVVALPLAKALGRAVVFYHTTWKDEEVAPDATPEEHMCPKARQVQHYLENRARALGIKYTTIIETHDDVSVGVVQCAARTGADLIALARGRKVKSGSYVSHLAKRSNIPLLTIKAEYNPDWQQEAFFETPLEKAVPPRSTSRRQCIKTFIERTPFLSRLRARCVDPIFVMCVVAVMYTLKVIMKTAAGTAINSPTITSDGLHNIADFFEALAVIAVIYVARRPSSEKYPYGRKNIEFFTSLVIGIGLLAMSLLFAFKSGVGLLAQFPVVDGVIRAIVWLPRHEPNALASSNFPWVLAVTLSSVILSVLVSRYQITVGRASQHDSLVADGEETFSDGKIEFVTLIGVLAQYFLGWHMAEYLLGILVAYLIARTGKELFLKSWRVLLQHSIGIEHDREIKKRCLSVRGVFDAIEVKTFQVGRIAVCHLTVTTRRSADAVENIKYAIERAVEEYVVAQDFIRCETHINFQLPDPQRHRQALAVLRQGDIDCIAPSLSEATHLIICDMEHGSVFRAHEEPLQGVDVGTLLKSKRVRSVRAFSENKQDAALLQGPDVAIGLEPIYSLCLTGVPAYADTL